MTYLAEIETAGCHSEWETEYPDIDLSNPAEVAGLEDQIVSECETYHSMAACDQGFSVGQIKKVTA